MNKIKPSDKIDYGFFTDQQLLDFFCQNKTKIATIENPLMFLRHLKDNQLITEDIYVKNSRDESDIYEALEYIEKRGKKKVRKFWECVDQEHILQRYPQLSEINAALKDALPKKQLNKTTRERSEDRSPGKEREVKKKKIESGSANNQAGPSSQTTHSQKQKADRVESEMNLWDMAKHKRWIPVTCGEEEALLDREALYNKKKFCIKHDGEMISPFTFEERGGKGACKFWKTSILCQGKTLSSLMEMDILKIPKGQGKFVLRQ